MDVTVVDNFITPAELGAFHARLSGECWRMGWEFNRIDEHPAVLHHRIATPEKSRGLTCDEALQESMSWSFVDPIWNRIKKYGFDPFTLLGIYANGHCPGQCSNIHVDVPPGESGRTALIYTNPIWDESWGGEIIFYNDARTEVQKAVMPLPGRLVVFDAAISHNVASPALSAKHLRVSIAFKTRKLS